MDEPSAIALRLSLQGDPGSCHQSLPLRLAWRSFQPLPLFGAATAALLEPLIRSIFRSP